MPCGRRYVRLVLRPGVAGALAWALAISPVIAQDIVDPTRPPPILASPGESVGNGMGLQSVFISDTRKAALIGGQLVELGQKYGDATLVRVDEGAVTLANGRETQVLRLFPGLDKKVLTAPAAVVPAAPGKKTSKQRKAK
jgi:MSHA biogenesis protein MshK